MSAARLSRIVWRARPLAERLRDADAAASPDAALAAQAVATVQHWRDVLGGDDAFRRRLAFHDTPGLDAARVGLLLARPPRAGLAPPAWHATLCEAVEAARAGPGSAPADVPFGALLAPLAGIALRRVRAAAHADVITDAALELHAELLLRELAELFARPLLLRFNRVRPPVDRLAAVIRAPRSAPHDTRRYDSFIAAEGAAGLLDLFDEFPVLARLGAILIDQWTVYTSELLARVHADGDVIAARFGSAHSDSVHPGRVTALTAGLSDRHNDGRTVARLEFESGLTLIYKPRSLTAEKMLADVLAHCAAGATAAAPHIGMAAVVARGGYGWMEYVPSLPCADEAAARRCFFAAGGVAALLHGLLGSDAHCDNIIACSDTLVIVDAETVPQPLLSTETPLPLTALRTGMLPQWEIHPATGSAHDITALGAETDASPASFMDWIAVNTDAMHRGPVQRTPPQPASVPRLRDAPLTAIDYLTELQDGFAAWHRLLRRERDALLDGPLQPLRNAAVRLVYRPTGLYVSLLQRCTAPDALRDGALRSTLLDVLRRPFLGGPEPSLHEAVYDAELDALDRLDVPYFTTRPGTAHLAAPSPAAQRSDTDMHAVLVYDFFGAPPADALRRHLHSLDDADLSLQVAVLRGAVNARFPTAGTRPQDTPQDTPPRHTSQDTLQPMSPAPTTSPTNVAGVSSDSALFLAEADAIARRIRDDAIIAADGTAFWLGATAHHGQDVLRFDLLGTDLYDGSAGIALFLAAHAAVTGHADSAALALAALAPLRRCARGELMDTRIGAARGMGGWIYALTRTGRLLGRDELRGEALAVAGFITADVVGNDRALDVMDGAAGAILGLLALHDHVGDDAILVAARACGDHLLRHRTGDTGRRAWRTNAATPITGFAHGAAGIACALARLAHATGESAYRAAALEGVAFETQQFDEAARDWTDAGREGVPVSHRIHAWCHGAPGIGMARLAGLRGLDSAGIRDDIDTAVHAVLTTDPPAVDHVCCGGAGHVDFLVGAALAGTGGAPAAGTLLQAAAQRAAAMVDRSRRLGGYMLFREPGRNVSPGFFQGLSGIGYTLLRLARPGLLPSVAAWE